MTGSQTSEKVITTDLVKMILRHHGSSFTVPTNIQMVKQYLIRKKEQLVIISDLPL